jgi:hypothetical protein
LVRRGLDVRCSFLHSIGGVLGQADAASDVDDFVSRACGLMLILRWRPMSYVTIAVANMYRVETPNIFELLGPASDGTRGKRHQPTEVRFPPVADEGQG